MESFKYKSKFKSFTGLSQIIKNKKMYVYNFIIFITISFKKDQSVQKRILAYI